MKTTARIFVSFISAAGLTLWTGWWYAIHYAGVSIDAEAIRRGLADVNVNTLKNPLFGAGLVATILLTLGFYRLLRIRTFIIVGRFASSLLFAILFTAAIDPQLVISLWTHDVYTEDGLVWLDVLSLAASAFFALWLLRKITRVLFSV